MKLQLNVNITTTHIHKYIIELGLFRWSIKEFDTHFQIVISDDKNLDGSYFSSTIKNDDGSWTLKLNKDDIFNINVTRRFFQFSANHDLV